MPSATSERRSTEVFYVMLWSFQTFDGVLIGDGDTDIFAYLNSNVPCSVVPLPYNIRMENGPWIACHCTDHLQQLMGPACILLVVLKN